MTQAAHSAEREEIGTVFCYFARALKTESEAGTDFASDESDALLFSELQDHMIAGIDTSASILTACAWTLSLPVNAQWQMRLRNELRSAKQPTAAADLEKLPMLDAILKEVFRLYAPVGGSQPRKTRRCVELGPHHHRLTVPSGTTVHSQAYTLHRSNVFKDPDTFDPGRWLETPPMELAELQRWYWPFGSGSRACIGAQLGTDNLKVAIATLFGKYHTEVMEGTTFALSKGIVSMPLDQGGYHLRLHLRLISDEF